MGHLAVLDQFIEMESKVIEMEEEEEEEEERFIKGQTERLDLQQV